MTYSASGGNYGTPFVQNPHPSISHLLGFMQRRLSDLFIPGTRSEETVGDIRNDRQGYSGAAETIMIHEPFDELEVRSNYHLNESPSLRRSGLLQPKSYNSSTSPSSPESQYSHDSIRAATVELSNMHFAVSPTTVEPSAPIPHSRDPLTSVEHNNAFIFPQSTTPRRSSPSDVAFVLESDRESLVSHSLASSFLRDLTSSTTSASGSGSGLDSSVVTLPPPQSSDISDEDESQDQQKKTPETKRLSGISLLRPDPSFTSSRSSSLSSTSSRNKKDVGQRHESPTPINSILPIDTTPTVSPMGTPRAALVGLVPQPTPNRVRWRSPQSLARQLGPSPSQLYQTEPEDFDEHTPLLLRRHEPLTTGSIPLPTSPLSSSRKPGIANGLSHSHDISSLNLNGDVEEGWEHFNFPSREENEVAKPRLSIGTRELKDLIIMQVAKTPEYLLTAFKSIPAVLLGCLLNILDGVSYGMIIFPATGVFSDLGGMGVSMFFVTTIVAQLIYSLGGSGFAGANGSMMIEVVPFFHILANSIADEIGEDKPLSIIATTLVAYALSSILTGLTFFLLGALKLGVVIGFFPRHILVGCIGGVGLFLIETGLTVSLRISEDDFTINWGTLQFMFLNRHNILIWTLPLFLAILLRIITHKFHHQLIFPTYFMLIPLVFYMVVFAFGLNLEDLRRTGWLFDMGHSTEQPWYNFYTYFDFGLVHYSAIWSTLPTQFALLFFNILHPPLNVPALAVSLDIDIDTNKELVAHGYSNFLAGLVGSVPNYLVYVNTLLFYRVGGNHRIAGFLLAIFTCFLLVLGSGPIAFTPVMVVGSLIFVLGIDLVKEALWDNRHRVSWSEYITILSIMVCMTAWDFVIGVLFGIIVCCFLFVVQNSQFRSIRSMYTGDLAMSAVRRPSLQRAYIREVSKQTTILRLQGFLFFGTITNVEETIRSLLEDPYWQHHMIQFLVLDFSLVAGVDMSSAEAFVRIHRLLAMKRVTLVFSGFTVESPVGKALRSVDLLGARGVEVFTTFSDAIEWTENAYLRAWFRTQKMETMPTSFVSGRQNADIDNNLVGSFIFSPRRTLICDAGDRTIATEFYPQATSDPDMELLNTITKAFSSYGNIDPVLFRPINNYFERISISAGHVLWSQGDPATGLFIIESGVLRATYEFANPVQHFEESMVPGTVAGEMSALADLPRNATVVAELPAVLWKLSNENIQKLQTEEPVLGRVFVQLVLKSAKFDYDTLLSAIAFRQ